MPGKVTGKMPGKLVVLVTCANLPEAKRIAQTLVDERLAACVNVPAEPVLSIYHWKGKVERAREIVLLAKTSTRLFGRLERRVRDLHSYQTPEIVAFAVAAGSQAYLDWLEASLTPQTRRAKTRRKKTKGKSGK